jgi:hypothetical protein
VPCSPSTFAPQSDSSSSIVAAAKCVVGRAERVAKTVTARTRRSHNRAGDNVSKIEIVQPIIERQVVVLGAARDGVPVGNDAA